MTGAGERRAWLAEVDHADGCVRPVRLAGGTLDRATAWVLDPFMGSGSTAVAAVQTGRRWVGYDVDPGYCEIARRRVAAAEAVLLEA